MNENIFFDPKKLKRCGENVIIGKTVRIRNPELVEIGDNVIIDDFTYISGNAVIGDYVHIAPGCVLSASGGHIHMGPFSGLAAGCKVYAGSSSYVQCGLDLPTIPKEHQYNVVIEDVTLEAFAVLGAGAVVLPGCHLPQGLTVAAGVKVSKKLKLEPWHLLLNDEGRTIRRRGVAELAERVNKFYKIEIKHV